MLTRGKKFYWVIGSDLAPWEGNEASKADDAEKSSADQKAAEENKDGDEKKEATDDNSPAEKTRSSDDKVEAGTNSRNGRKRAIRHEEDGNEVNDNGFVYLLEELSRRRCVESAPLHADCSRLDAPHVTWAPDDQSALHRTIADQPELGIKLQTWLSLTADQNTAIELMRQKIADKIEAAYAAEASFNVAQEAAAAWKSLTQASRAPVMTMAGDLVQGYAKRHRHQY
ncbi:hypothetical protein CLAFUR4_12183 [Fulvia fulva]|nr:hypothetical protein CLAFUR4_12183 [Fulvia fulva]